ncbi:MAG: TonB-dependent receptor [Ferruginibacter sp.]|nr:TonB-dependent receptor [Ferruginibacter sp.]
MRKNHKNYFKFLIPFLLLFSSAAFSQSNTGSVSGIVRTSTGQEIVGVSVIAKNTSTNLTSGTQTDEKGLFKFNLLPIEGKYSFSFSAIGYETQTLSGYTLKGDNTVSIIVKLKDTSSSLSAVTVVGYGTQKKRDITTAVVGIKTADIENQPINNVAEAMVGKLAGVQVTQGNGTPGGALNIKVRGVGTITAGSSPLYVIDGVPISNNNINTLNNNDIASVEVLKDASSAAIYGSRGSNGVVLITTKQGKAGKTQINYNSFYGVQQVAHKIKMMDAYQYSSMVLDARNNSYNDAMVSINKKRVSLSQVPIAYGLTDNNGVRLANTANNTNVIIPQEILPYLTNTPGLTNTDWQNEIYRKAPIQNHSISASGATDKIKYYTSLEYFNQDGIVINSGFKRYSGRINVEANKGIFKFGVNFSPSLITEKRVNTDGPYSTGGVVASALHNSPLWSVYNTDGSYNFAQNAWSGATNTILPSTVVVSGNAQTNAWNPVALAKLQKDDVSSNRMTGNIFTEAAITKTLKYKLNVGFDIFNSSENTFRPSTIPLANTAANTESVASGSSATAKEFNYLIEQTLNYSKKIGAHSFNILGGISTQKDVLTNNYALASRGFVSNQITTLNAGIVTAGSSNESQWALASGIARVQYNYLGKYLLTGSMRADGSSRFGANNRWGYFPSASIGWRLSDENFMKNSKLISDFKLRASYGLTGNFNIPNYGAQGALSYNAYVFGGATSGAINGAAPSSLPNPNLSWEKTAQLNAGFDAAFFHNKLNLSFDWYNSNTSDLLLDVPVPISTGFTTQLQNIGKVNNKGIDVNIGTDLNIGKVKFTASANYSRNVNKVVQLGPGNADIVKTNPLVANAFYLTRVGLPIGTYFLPQVLGVFKTQAEVDAYPHFIDAASNFDLATSKPGDFKFLDADGDGKIDFTKDRVASGNYLPKFTYGFATSAQYKGVDIAIAMQGVYGNKILNLSRRYFYNDEGNMNNYIGTVNRFISEANPGSGVNVRANRVAKGGNGTTSSWHVEDGSYLRIRNISLGYSLQDNFLKKYNVTKVRLYVTMQNPFTFTKYLGYSPEVSNRNDVTSNGEDYGVYPTSKTTSIGINLTF